MKFPDIGEVTARSGTRASALRYYEEVGVIASIARHGLRRQYGPEVLLQLKLIALGQSAGFGLEISWACLAAMASLICPRMPYLQKSHRFGRITQPLQSAGTESYDVP